jgi:hypothetical protein
LVAGPGPGPEPIGHPGIVCFTSDLRVAWRYGGEFGFVMDCYALNVAGETAALVGGYGSDHDRVVVGTLAGEQFEPRVHARLRLPGGVGLQGARLVGRGSELHVLAGTAWSKIALEDLIG